ncbi:hypothetical protein ABZP36_009916 [Zizania latifolia]
MLSLWTLAQRLQGTSWIYGLNNFNREILIPNVHEVNMDDATLVLSQEVLKKLDNIRKKKESDDNNAEIDDNKGLKAYLEVYRLEDGLQADRIHRHRTCCLRTFFKQITIGQRDAAGAESGGTKQHRMAAGRGGVALEGGRAVRHGTEGQ